MRLINLGLIRCINCKARWLISIIENHDYIYKYNCRIKCPFCKKYGTTQMMVGDMIF